MYLEEEKEFRRGERERKFTYCMGGCVAGFECVREFQFLFLEKLTVFELFCLSVINIILIITNHFALCARVCMYV